MEFKSIRFLSAKPILILFVLAISVMILRLGEDSQINNSDVKLCYNGLSVFLNI